MSVQKIDVNRPKDIRIYLGTSGSGKSHAMKQHLRDRPRVIAFDPEGEYHGRGWRQYTSVKSLAQAISGRAAYRVALVGGSKEMFSQLCKLSLAAATASAPLLLMVDELAGVDSTAKAPDGWHDCLTRGRKHGLDVWAGAQSPTEISKTIMRQRNRVWCGRMTRDDDYAYMSRELQISANYIASLRPRPHFDHIMIAEGERPVIVRDNKAEPVPSEVLGVGWTAIK